MLAIADLHFGHEKDSFLQAGKPVQRVDLWDKLCVVGDACRHTGQALSVMGDIFDRVNPTSEVIATWFHFLSLFSDVQIYIIAGNHDAGVDWANTTMIGNADLPNVYVATSPEIVLVKDSTGSANVMFYPHIPLGDRDKTPSISEVYSDAKPDFIMTHGQVMDSDYTNDIFFEAGTALSLDFADLPESLIFAGHIHAQNTYRKGNTAIIYPGSLTINNFGEVDEIKGYLSIPLSDPSSFEFATFSEKLGTPWKHVELDLTEKSERDLDVDLIKELATGSIIKITTLAKAYGIVDEAYIRALFNRFGHVTRYETKITTDRTEVIEAQDTISHEALLGEWLDDNEDLSAKMKKKTLRRGAELLAEVLS